MADFMPTLGVNAMQCCGIRELSVLSAFKRAEDALVSFGKSTYFFMRAERKVYDPNTMKYVMQYDVLDPQDKFRYVVFSQAGGNNGSKDGYGFRFAAFIRDNQLGELVETGFHKNPNSGNDVKVWIWTVNHERTKPLVAKLSGRS